MKHLLSITLFLLSVLAFGQTEEFVSPSSKITHGTLANGIAYYIVRNDVSKSCADFALVQKGNFARQSAQDALEHLPHFGDIRPYEYLASKGIGYTISGLASYSPAGVVYRFQNVPVQNSAVSDSLLLMTFDLMQTSSMEQAVIVSGDIDPAKILDRMQTLSMIVSPRQPYSGPMEFAWDPCDSIIFECKRTPSYRLGRIEATYYMQRVPSAEMNTVQPLIAQMFAGQTCDILERRIRAAFRDAGIPVGSISTRYRGSHESVYEERCAVAVTVDKDQLAQASRVLGEVASALDTLGVGRNEFSLIKNAAMARAAKKLPEGSGSNPSYVNKCIASYLFGASLAEDSARNAFFSQRILQTSQERTLLNSYISSLLDRDRNLILHYTSPDFLFSRDSLVGEFQKGWDESRARPARTIVDIDSTRLEIHSRKVKIKLKSNVPDLVSGGQLWTFSNGLKVLYKKTGSGKKVNFGFLFNGGCGNTESFEMGELAFANDLFGMYEVAGIPAPLFQEYLRYKGIDLEGKIGLSDVRFTGSAPSSSIPTLFKAMHALSTSRKLDRREYDYYKSCQYLRFEENKRSEAGIKSLMGLVTFPSYRYSSHRIERYLTDAVPAKTEKLLDEKFANWSDGLIVIVGDVDENALKDYLLNTLGAFPPGKVQYSRMMAQRPLASGSTMLSSPFDSVAVGPRNPSVNIRLTTQIPFNIKRKATLDLCAEALRDRLIRELAPQGMYVKVAASYDLLPNEIMSLEINCNKCTGAGLPNGVGPADADFAVKDIRRALDQMASQPIPAETFKAMKERCVRRAEARVESAPALVEAILTRYSEGKDLRTGLVPAVKEVQSSDVAELMKALLEGTDVEYIVN